MRQPLQLTLPLPQPQPGSKRLATLSDRLYELLRRRGRPLEVGHVVAQVLRAKTCPQRLQRRLVAELVDADSRLCWRGRDLVGLAPEGWAALPLGEATFCVVDLETTGATPGGSKVTEIGAVRLRGGRVIERFVTLVDPGRPMPPVIAALTGIDDRMVVGQPRIDEALERFSAFVGDDVMVAHNAPFDLRFLNYERHRLQGRYFTQPWLDTLVLAKRLLRRRLERFDLATLSDWAATEVRPCHRALPDAEATAEVLASLLGLLEERGHRTLEAAVGLGQGGGARYAHKLALTEALPSAPGVYVMRDRHGRVLYVGKAANLRRRVRAYFGPQGRHGRLIGRALEDVERIEHQVLGSEFEALLREARLLHEMRPRANRRGVNAVGRRYLKLSLTEDYPRLYVVDRPTDDGSAYYGPLRSERALRLALDAIHLLLPLRTCHHLCPVGSGLVPEQRPRCAGPCQGGDPSSYSASVERARRLLEGRVGPCLAELVEGLRERPAWEDADAREGLEALLGLVASLARLRRVRATWAVVVEPSPEPGMARAFLVAAGRVVDQRDLCDAAWARAEAKAALGRLRSLGADSEALLAPEALEEAMIVEARVRALAGRPTLVPLEPDFDEAAAHRGVMAAVRDVLAEHADEGEVRPAA